MCFRSWKKFSNQKSWGRSAIHGFSGTGQRFAPDSTPVIGAYAIQGDSELIIEEISGLFSNVVGLPVEANNCLGVGICCPARLLFSAPAQLPPQLRAHQLAFCEHVEVELLVG